MIARGNPQQDYIRIENILDKVNEVDILAYYLNITHIPCVINSPLRKDENPSFGLKKTIDGNSIFYKDFRTGESGSLFSLLSQYFNLSFIDTLIKVWKDIPNMNSSVTISRKVTRKEKRVVHDELKVKVRDWRQWDIDYWGKVGVSKEWATFCRIYPISHIFITKNNIEYIIPADKYAYVYVEFKDGKPTYKVYQPYSKLYKWRSKHDSSVWDLWEQLPETGENLIITSSRKDAACIWATTGIPCVSLQAESCLPKPQVIQQLKERFKNIYVLYDNDFTKVDNPGLTLGKKLCNMFDLIFIFIPTNYKQKDSSDLYSAYGADVVREVIFNLIKKNNEKNYSY